MAVAHRVRSYGEGGVRDLQILLPRHDLPQGYLIVKQLLLSYSARTTNGGSRGTYFTGECT
jgi:hypothetical protein